MERAASAPHPDHEGPVYPGTCAGRRGGRGRLADRRFAGVSGCRRIRRRFDDGFRGPTHVDLRSARRRFRGLEGPGAATVPATPAYQLAVVVDDAAQGVTEVVRGDDLVPSTPRQLLLYQALGLLRPAFMHVPLVVGPDGRRLAKRHGDTRLSACARRECGRRRCWVCWRGRAAGSSAVEPITARELVPLFRLDSDPARVPSS